MIFNPFRFYLLTKKSYSVRTSTALTKNFCSFAKGRFNFYFFVVFKSPQETLQLIKTCWVNWRRSDSNSKMKKNESNSKWVIQLLRLVFSLLLTVFSKFLEGSLCVIFIFGFAIKIKEHLMVFMKSWPTWQALKLGEGEGEREKSAKGKYPLSLPNSLFPFLLIPYPLWRLLRRLIKSLLIRNCNGLQIGFTWTRRLIG